MVDSKSAKETDLTQVRHENPRVGILMGSASDWPIMKAAAQALENLEIPWEARVISAHRTPERLTEYLRTAEDRGVECLICGAGHAAHLAGVTAAQTLIPVLGVPIASSALQGFDALLATVQMPGGIPVGTLAVGSSGAKNAALLAAAFFARHDDQVRKRLAEFREKQSAAVPETPY